MMFGKTKLELKVGIFVFTGLVILVTFILLIGDFKTWTSGCRINFLFDFINGVKVGAPVRLSGVDVGQVKEINFIFNPQENKTKVRITGWIRKEVKVPIDSTIWINTLGLLGEKYVEIIPGKDYAHLVTDEPITGEEPIATHEIAKLAKNIASDLDESIVKIKNKEGTIGKLLYDDTIYNELEALVTDIRQHPWKLFFKTKEKPEKK